MRGRYTLVLVCMLAAPVSASLIEDITGGTVTYQFDGGTDRDAPDTCPEASEGFAVSLGNHTHGYLLPQEDEADHYVLEVGQELVGGRLTITFTNPESDVEVAMDVRVPGCEGSVLDESEQPAAPPAHPEAGEGEQSVALTNMEDTWSCASEWFFVANQMHGLAAPESIHVVWTDGTQADVPLDKETPATVAHYRTSQNLGVSLHSASIILPDDWKGRFNVGHGPCDTVDGGAVFGAPATSSADGLQIRFTPIETGTYVVAIVLEFEAPDPVQQVGSLFKPQPASCHACVDGTKEPFDPLMYLLLGDSEEHVA